MPIFSPNSRQRPAVVKPQVIVLHSTGGSFASAVNWFLSKVSKVSAHYVVKRDGGWRKMVPLDHVAYHAGKARWQGHTDVNTISVGIELCHVDRKDDWPEEQMQAVIRLIRDLRSEYGPLPVVGHCDVAIPHGRKIDPYGFPFTRIPPANG